MRERRVRWPWASGSAKYGLPPPEPPSAWVELHRTDVLADTIAPLAILPEPQISLASIPAGRHEDGADWLFNLYGTHILIAGATGAGKVSVLVAEATLHSCGCGQVETGKCRVPHAQSRRARYDLFRSNDLQSPKPTSMPQP
jgi:hypothetical protein